MEKVLDPRDALYHLDDEYTLKYIDKCFSMDKKIQTDVAHAVAWYGRLVAIRRVLELGFPVLDKNDYHGDMLHNVINHCHGSEVCDIIDLLVSKGADVNGLWNDTCTGPKSHLQIVQNHIDSCQQPWDGARWQDIASPVIQQKLKNYEVIRDRLIFHGAK